MILWPFIWNHASDLRVRTSPSSQSWTPPSGSVVKMLVLEYNGGIIYLLWPLSAAGGAGQKIYWLLDGCNGKKWKENLLLFLCGYLSEPSDCNKSAGA